MHVGVLQGPGRLGLQEPPGASRGLQGPPMARGLWGLGASKSPKPDFERKMRPLRTAKGGRNFTRDGEAGLGHPPLGGGAEVRQGLGVSAKRSGGGFLSGSERRPEAGCLGEYHVEV